MKEMLYYLEWIAGIGLMSTYIAKEITKEKTSGPRWERLFWFFFFALLIVVYGGRLLSLFL